MCFVLSNVIKADCDEDIFRTFQQKIVEEGERTELGYLGLLREVLASLWKEKQGVAEYTTEDGFTKISNKETYDKFNEQLKQQYGQGVSPAKFKEYLLEFGFTDALNRTKLKVPIPDDSEPKSRLCNIFTQRVLRKLGLEEKTTEKELPLSLTIQEALGPLRAKWQKGYAEDFDRLVVEVKGCTIQEAEQLREKWIEDGLLAYNAEGLLCWVR